MSAVSRMKFEDVCPTGTVVVSRLGSNTESPSAYMMYDVRYVVQSEESSLGILVMIAAAQLTGLKEENHTTGNGRDHVSPMKFAGRCKQFHTLPMGQCPGVEICGWLIAQ